MPPSAPSATTSKPSAASAGRAAGRSAAAARTATAGLVDLIFGSPAAPHDGRCGQVSLPAGRRLLRQTTVLANIKSYDEVRKPRARPARAWKNIRDQLLPVRFAMALLLNIDVPDVEAGVRFYTAAFGL